MFHATPQLPPKNAKDLDVLHSLASAHLMFGLTGTATALLRLAYWLDPNSFKTLELLANAAFRSGDGDSALSALKQLEQFGADIPLALQNRQRLHLGLQAKHAVTKSGPSD